MALARDTFTLSGVGPYAITFPRLSNSYVIAYIDGVLQTSTLYTIVSNNLTFLSSPSGTTLVLERETAGSTEATDDILVTDFTDGGALLESDLENALTQAIHIGQEAIRTAEDAAASVTGSGNLPTPTGAQATGYVLVTSGGSFVVSSA
mgnify:CR=1 FL=1